jgi:hypothetical protein
MSDVNDRQSEAIGGGRERDGAVTFGQVNQIFTTS